MFMLRVFSTPAGVPQNPGVRQMPLGGGGVQSLRQVSVSTLFPSSHCSPPLTMLSPHTVQLSRHVLPLPPAGDPGGSQVSPGTLTTPSPQNSPQDRQGEPPRHFPRLACHLPRPFLRSVRPQPSDWQKKGARCAGRPITLVLSGRTACPRCAPWDFPYSCLPDPLQGPVNACPPVMGNNLLDSSGKSRQYLLRRDRTPHHHSSGYTNPRPADGAGSSLP
jgi:hypothetical protein